MATTARASARARFEETLTTRDWQDDDRCWDTIADAMCLVDMIRGTKDGLYGDSDNELVIAGAEAVLSLVGSIDQALTFGADKECVDFAAFAKCRAAAFEIQDCLERQLS